MAESEGLFEIILDPDDDDDDEDDDEEDDDDEVELDG